jgi:hypothetical protein
LRCLAGFALAALDAASDPIKATTMDVLMLASSQVPGI